MKKTIIIFLIFILIMASACDATSNNSNANFQGSDSAIESITPNDPNEKEDNNLGENENVDGSEDFSPEDIEKDENGENGDNVIKPITGGGDFNAGDNY